MPVSPGPVVKVTDLWKRYAANGEGAPALRGASLEVNRGEIVAILGKSGSGKTTLLNILAGLDRPSGGSVEIDGLDMERLAERGRTELRRRHIGFVFQFFNLLPTLTAMENVSLSLELAGRQDQEAARRSLVAVGLEGKESRYPHELSGGEQQRVAIARAIVKNPALILADEPTGNLDTTTGDLILNLLAGTCREFSASLIVVTHTLLTRRFADRVLLMKDGALVEDTEGSGLTR